MADPTEKVRRGTYERDGERCVSCGTAWGLTFQHRRAVGQGGSKVRPDFADGCAACASCNERFEHDLQGKALRLGWKVPRWVKDPSRVPLFHVSTQRWYRLVPGAGRRVIITAEEAALMRLDVYGPEIEEEVSRQWVSRTPNGRTDSR